MERFIDSSDFIKTLDHRYGRLTYADDTDLIRFYEPNIVLSTQQS